MGKTTCTLEQRFWSKVDKTDTCWLWTGTITDNGYGHFWHVDRNRGAHRVSWELSGGQLPDGLVIDHICRTRHCVRPDHLRLATLSQNRQNHPGAPDYPTVSGIRGVHRHGKRWAAEVIADGTRYRKVFDTVEEAAAAAKAARLRLHTHNDADRVA